MRSTFAQSRHNCTLSTLNGAQTRQNGANSDKNLPK